MARRDETPRDLLFGLLALHTGLIDQDQLLAAFGAWSRAKGSTLAEILIERGSIDAESRSILNAMAEKQLKLHGGDAEKSLAAIAVGPSTREKLAALGDSDLTASVAHVGSHTTAPNGAATMSVGTATSEGQRFRVLRFHAQGGLGAVFVALDGELNREVALKQILDRHADDEISRTRFLIEAEITGGLEHPGIVPVYGLGHYGNGRPYYAMRFIRGDSLKEAISAFHTDESLIVDPGKRSLALRKLLRRFVDVCNAVDYAHGRGVLHRDLKPGNVIVGRYGETFVVDWGLAKAIGRAEAGSKSDERTLMPSSSSGSAETLPGLAIGTPAYMSPEQALGDLEKLGPRSDVYSLGATLYTLLTGRPPFDMTDPGTMFRQVQEGAFPPPHHIDPSIERALEAVCLKAMATKPEDRHVTARALADDIDRWAADEPTSAWAEPFSVRARRWMRRNRTAVTAASATLLMAVVGLAGVLAVEARANKALTAKNSELDNANRLKDEANAGLLEANDRVQARFELAREAIRSFQAGVNEDDMLKGKELEGLRNKLLRSAAGFYERLEKLLQGQTDRPSRAILAQSYFELGDLTEKIGIKPEALAVHRKSLAIRRDLAAGTNADASSTLDLARSLIAAGLLAEATGDNAGALAAYEEARTLARPLADGSGSTVAARDILGTTHHRIGRVLSITGKPAEALESYRRAETIRRKLAEESPAVTHFRSSLADTYNNIGLVHSQTGQPAEALESHRLALEIRQKLADENPAVTEFRNRLAYSYVSLGYVHSQTGQPAEALESYRRALAIQLRLADENPAVTEFRNRLATTHDSIGLLHSQTGRPTEALESYRLALAIYQKLADENPAVTEFLGNLAGSYFNIGFLQFQTGKPAESLESSRRALAIYQKLADENPAVTQFRSSLANSHISIGILQTQAGLHVEALESQRRALAIYQKLADENPSFTHYQRNLSVTHYNIGRTQELTGQLADALESHRHAVAIQQRLADENPAVTDFRNDLASSHFGIGLIQSQAGHPAEASESYRLALSIQQKLADENPTVTQYRGNQADSHISIGNVQSQTGQPAEALESYRLAVAILQKLADENPAATDFRNRLALIHYNISDVQWQTGHPAEALESQRRALAIRQKLADNHPKIVQYQSDLASSLSWVGKFRFLASDVTGAMVEFRQAVAIMERLPVNTAYLYDLACYQSLLAAVSARPGSGVSDDEQEALALAAVTTLRRTIGSGYRDVSHMRTDTDLDPLRSRPDFQLLMRDLAFPADPFAR
jgi:eukaryotic-like serine/threonine-protein kinase